MDFHKLVNNHGYYFRRTSSDEAQVFEENYWGAVVDPDGHVRNMEDPSERQSKRDLAADELRFVNGMTAGKILDVGCGTGAFLEGVQESWEKFGVELSGFAAEVASRYCDVFHGTLAEARYPDNHFDVVILFHVIEHMKDPEKELLEIRRVLKTGGILIVGTPDFDSACARRYGENFRLLHDETHISLFSERSLQTLLEDSGFQVVKTEYPFFETKYFTIENLERLFEKKGMSPPFYGSIFSKFAVKISRDDVIKQLESKLDVVRGKIRD